MRCEHAPHDDADGERQRRELRRHAGKLPTDRQADAAAERRVPAAAAPPAARRLELRDADVELADGRRRGEQVTVRRVDLREHFELREPRRDAGLERRTQRVGVEQVETARQADNPRPARLRREPPVRELADLLPDRRARDAERSRELLARMRTAVGQARATRRSAVTRVTGRGAASAPPGSRNRDSVPSSMRRMLPRCA